MLPVSFTVRWILKTAFNFLQFYVATLYKIKLELTLLLPIMLGFVGLLLKYYGA